MLNFKNLKNKLQRIINIFILLPNVQFKIIIKNYEYLVPRKKQKKSLKNAGQTPFPADLLFFAKVLHFWVIF